MPLLTVFLEPLGLRKRRGSLFAVHRVQQVYLFFLFEKGQLIGRVQGNLLFIYHIQQFGDKLRQADIALHLPLAFTGLACNKLNRSLRLLANLARS